MNLRWICLALVTSVSVTMGGQGGLSSNQLRRMEQLTSLVENDTIEIQYEYCTELHDGRGITAGRGGFTTANDEVYTIVKTYTQRSPHNVLIPFLPALKRLADDESGEVVGLQGFKNAWKAASADPIFRAVQDEYVDREYLAPAMERAKKAGLRTALAKAAVFDTMVQHGDDGDADSLSVLMDKAAKTVSGTPANGVDEKKWLHAFLEIRRADLAHASDPETRKEWAKSVDRCDVFEALAAAGNYNLDGPMKIDTDAWEATIP